MLSNRAIELIEEAFSNFMIGKDDESIFINKLTTALDNLPFNNEKTFNVTIEKKALNHHEFFGFHVFPTIDGLLSVCDMCTLEPYSFDGTVKGWRAITAWEVVIDRMVFDRTNVSFNPKELTAMILHEIGHVTQSDEPITQFCQAYIEAKSKMPLINKISLRHLSMLYMIPLATACMQRRWVNPQNEINLEISSDKSLIEYGYTEQLANAYNKIIKVSGSINTDVGHNYNKIEASVEWANSNIIDVTKRRDKMKDSLYYKAIQEDSSYVQAVCSFILDRLGVVMRERYTGYVAENCMLNELINGTITLESHIPTFNEKTYNAVTSPVFIAQKNYQAANEAFFNKRKNTKVDLPDEYDIDRIYIAIDDIQNNYDKVYVLDMIYANIEKLNNFEEAIAMDEAKSKKYASKIADMRDRLNTLRKLVMTKNIAKKEYKVFVKVPEGYEG